MRAVKNNKGYMLVEIILASVIAFGITYFIVDLTIKLKNKNFLDCNIVFNFFAASIVFPCIELHAIKIPSLSGL